MKITHFSSLSIIEHICFFYSVQHLENHMAYKNSSLEDSLLSCDIPLYLKMLSKKEVYS